MAKNGGGAAREVVGYLRVSTKEQARGGVSLDFQREAIEGYARAHGLRLVHVYAESDGISGKDLANRPALREAVAAACDRGAALCVYSLSRASRSTRDAVHLAELLAKYGAEMISITENIDTTKAAGRLMFRTFASFAEFEREAIVERVREGMAECRRQGKRTGRANRLPYGFRLAADDPKRMEPHPGERRRLAIIRRRRDAGAKWRDIAHELNARGLLRRNRKPWNGYEAMRALERDENRRECG